MVKKNGQNRESTLTPFVVVQRNHPFEDVKIVETELYYIIIIYHNIKSHFL